MITGLDKSGALAAGIARSGTTPQDNPVGHNLIKSK
jgi:hypothetical protein